MPVPVVILVVVSSVIAVAAGVAVFRVDSMARATFALLASFVFAAVPILAVGLPYLGVLMILMMAMEMMVMVVFMLMFMMNPAGLMPMKMVHNERASAVIAGVVFLLLALGALLTPWSRFSAPGGTDPTRMIGLDIMGARMPVMILIGLVLFAAIVSAVVLAVPRNRYERYGDDLDRAEPADPIRGGLRR